MRSRVLNRWGEVALSTEPEGAARGPGPAAQQAIPNEAAGAPVPDEVLIADSRGALTPSRVVEQRLAALLRLGPPRPFGEAGRARDARRATGEVERAGPPAAEERAPRGAAESGAKRMNATVPGVQCAGNVSIRPF